MKRFSGLALILALAAAAPAAPPGWRPDWPALRPVWKARLASIRATGRTPIFDIESSFSETYTNLDVVLKYLDEQAVAIVAFSPENDVPPAAHETLEAWTVRWQDMLRRLVERHGGQVFPVPPAGELRGEGENSRRALEAQLEAAETEGYPMLGEYFFRHYSSNMDIQEGVDHDLSEPIDGELGALLFAFSQRTGKPFQIHYEIEDRLIAPLEAMLSRYPGAKVIWCHAGRLRRADKAPVFARQDVPTLRRLLAAHPNLYFDLSALSFLRYPGTNKPDSLCWDERTHRLRGDWQRLIADHPWRFLAALDIGSNRAAGVPETRKRIADLLEELPPGAREIVAYKAAWRLLFGEILDDAALPAAPR